MPGTECSSQKSGQGPPEMELWACLRSLAVPRSLMTIWWPGSGSSSETGSHEGGVGQKLISRETKDVYQVLSHSFNPYQALHRDYSLI